jgi:hypothetical protein
MVIKDKPQGVEKLYVLFRDLNFHLGEMKP